MRFSQAKNVDLAKKESMLLRLLKLLRERVSYYALTQEKVKLSDFNLEAIFDKFVNADEIDSTASTEENSSLYWQRYELVKWFLQHYEVFTNDAAEYKKETMLMSRFSHSERAYMKCFYIKIEQKKDTKIDFTESDKIPQRGHEPVREF